MSFELSFMIIPPFGMSMCISYNYIIANLRQKVNRFCYI
nr:MAG TPA: hypothetical protein [Caudoviricetes sp.]